MQDQKPFINLDFCETVDKRNLKFDMVRLLLSSKCSLKSISKKIEIEKNNTSKKAFQKCYKVWFIWNF